MLSIKELDKTQLQRANSVSFNNDRGDIRDKIYKSCIDEILKWNISEVKKQKILDRLYQKNMEILKYEASFISVIVSGPAKYNELKREKEAGKIVELASDFNVWFSNLEKQYKSYKNPSKKDLANKKVEEIMKLHKLGLDIKNELIDLSNLDNKKFIELFEKFNSLYKWKKNTVIYKVYIASKNGEIKEKDIETLFEDENFTAYLKNDRVFIKFVFKPQAQLKFALKKKGYWWNSREKSWSTYPSRLDMAWVKSISSKYEKYL